MAYEPRTDELPAELPEVFPDPDGLAPRQRGSRTDPSMRDGNSSHGNPYEMEGSEPTTDNDTGDVEGEPVTAGIDGGAAEGTTAEMRADLDPGADDFTLRSEEDGPDAGSLDDEDWRDDAPPPAVTDVLPHPDVEAGTDGSTVGRSIPAASHARAEPEPARETGDREPAGMPTAHETGVGEPAHEEEDRGGNLPIEGYEQLTVAEIARRAAALPAEDLKHIRTHEAHHRKRKTLLAKLDRLLKGGEGKKPRRGSEAGGEG